MIEAKESGVQQTTMISVLKQTSYPAVLPPVVTRLKRWWISVRVRLRLAQVAYQLYGSVSGTIKAVRKLQQLKHQVNGKEQLRRCVTVNNKYYFGIYVPGFPSKVFDHYVMKEMNNLMPSGKNILSLEIIQLAITSKCPLQCEHCFEWKNLNQKDPFTKEELQQIIQQFQKAGCTQFHLTGGEPLVKLSLIEELVRSATADSEFWVLTSGFRFTKETAQRLKEAGVTGVIISVDHYDEALHNLFRGSDAAFSNAMDAAWFAREAGLVTAFSICVTQSFATRENLMRYANLAKDCGVSFVQLLEPKAVGHYENKPVLLSTEQIAVLDAFYLMISFEPEYQSHPVFLYHGYHQRKLGCFSGGSRILYIDSAGFINACPFCQTKSYKASDLIHGELTVADLNIGGCPTYTKREP